jgi:hypothetical protein
MDKAPAYGAGDSGFESQYGLVFFLVSCVFCSAVLAYSSTENENKNRGDARIELATSCTRSRNHTTRPITRGGHGRQNDTTSDKRKGRAKGRDVLELNQRPIGLQPIALPLS